MTTPEEASAALHDLMHGDTKWLYALAMGAGCTTEAGGDPVYQGIREWDRNLRAIIAEHKEG